MGSELKLPSLEIVGFRGLRHLRIERLGRVNLIVGKNNVGKTSVLEAVRLYGTHGSPSVLIEVLEARDEFEISESVSSNYTTSVPVESLFYGRAARVGSTEPIEIGPLGGSGMRLKIELDLLEPPPRSEQQPQVRPEAGLVPERLLTLKQTFGTDTIWVPIVNALALIRYKDDYFGPLASMFTGFTKPSSPTIFVGPGGISPNQCGKLWDEVTLTELEEDVLCAMRLVSPDLDKLSFRAVSDKSAIRVPFVRTKEASAPIPLRSLGDGINRMFGVALALVSAKNGILAIDEVENGLHYSIQPDLWRFVFQTASRLNVQVFATSHSYDCIRAFQAAADEHEEEGVLIRLRRKDGEIRVTEFDEKELAIAVEGQMEVR